MLGISRQAYYQWLSNPVSQRDWDDAHLINAALDIHADDPAAGYRFIADELAQRGFTASENRVWRICSMQQIFSLHVKKKGRTRQAGPPVHDDLVRRDFTADAPNVKWLTDITEHPTDQGKLYLCAIKDCYSNKIVGYSIDSRMTSSLAVAALRNAITLRDPARVIVHSDRGSQFRSKPYRRLLRNNGLKHHTPVTTKPGAVPLPTDLWSDLGPTLRSALWQRGTLLPTGAAHAAGGGASTMVGTQLRHDVLPGDADYIVVTGVGDVYYVDDVASVTTDAGCRYVAPNDLADTQFRSMIPCSACRLAGRPALETTAGRTR